MLDGIKEIETYIYRWHNIVSQYISTLPILDLCMKADMGTRSQVTTWWGYQEGLVLTSRQAVGGEASYSAGCVYGGG